MDQQPSRRARGRARGFSQQMERPQRPQQSQQMQRPQQPQQSQQMQRPQQMQGPQQPQQSQQMQRHQQRQGPQQPQQMQRHQQRQEPQQMQGPRQLQVPQQIQPRPQGVYMPRPSGEASRSIEEVKQVTTLIKDITTKDIVPIGRGAVRGRRTLDTVEYFRAPRPESSKNGKQGTTGQPIQLMTNYFPITSYTNWSLYQYKINFNPEEDRIIVKRGLLKNHKEFLGPYIFDGESMFSSTKYESKKFELASKRTSDDQIIIMSIEFVNTIETNDYANIQVFNLLIRNCLRHLNLKLIGRNYYDSEAKIEIPKYKLELWPGYETTIGMLDNGLLLRAEITTKVMRNETVLDFYEECMRDRDPNCNKLIKFKSGVIGTVVLTRYNNKTYRIDDVDEHSNIHSTFKTKDGTLISYKDYYEKRWNYTSSYNRQQPLLVSKIKKSLIYDKNKDEETLVYLVPEFCSLTGLSDAMRNNFNLMKDMSEYTRVNPKKRIERYYNFINRLQSIPECLETFKNWNLTLGSKLIDVTGRVLPFENIGSNNSQYNGGLEADWSRSLRSLPMFTCVRMNRWVIVTPNIVAREIHTFTSKLQDVGKGMSFSLPDPETVLLQGPTLRDYVICLERIINDKNPSFILCVLTTQRGDFYNTIKRKLCVDRAVPSQVVLMKHIQKINMSVCTKIAIQINCKLGGAPWFVNIPLKGMMIMGFDVCHDNQNKSVSYGALVASLNDTHTSYFSCVQPHRSGEELSTHFSISVAKALDKYRSKNGMLPKSIIIYRDGVGDGQLSYVHSVEISNIKKAFTEFYGKDPPPFAFIIVKKRISTRFFVQQKGIPQNPQPGTVIDQVVTDPSMYDFFLVSQNVKFGTVTPTHYNIIEDTLVNWTPDKMQRLTYKLTHMYYNWAGTVRVPAPCQLAHKLAFLTAQSLKTSPNTGLDELLYFL